MTSKPMPPEEDAEAGREIGLENIGSEEIGSGQSGGSKPCGRKAWEQVYQADDKACNRDVY